MSTRIIDFPDSLANATAPTFGDGLGEGSLIPHQETPTGTVNGVNATFALANLPFSEDSCAVFVNGVKRIKDTEWNLSGQNIIFTAGNIPQLGQSVYVYYFRESTVISPPAGADPITEFRTLSGAEVTAKQLTLTQTPDTASEVSVDLIGGSAQFYATDYTVSSNILSWNGLGLDGVVATGDKLRIMYTF